MPSLESTSICLSMPSLILFMSSAVSAPFCVSAYLPPPPSSDSSISPSSSSLPSSGYIRPGEGFHSPPLSPAALSMISLPVWGPSCSIVMM